MIPRRRDSRRKRVLTCGLPVGWFVLPPVNSGCHAAQPRPKADQRHRPTSVGLVEWVGDRLAFLLDSSTDALEKLTRHVRAAAPITNSLW